METYAGQNLRVLVVEDSPDCAQSLATCLRLFGHTVEVASDGQEAMEMAGTFHPHAVLLDVAIPRIEVARRLSANRPNLTPLIITISGFGPEVLEQWGGHARIDRHMVKPVDPELMRGVLDRFGKVLDGVAAPVIV